MAFIPFDWSAADAASRLPPTFLVDGYFDPDAEEAMAMPVEQVHDDFGRLLSALGDPDGPASLWGPPSTPILCGRVEPIFCVDAIRGVLDNLPEFDGDAPIVVESDCPPGAWCAALTRYYVSFLLDDVGTAWPPTFNVLPGYRRHESEVEGVAFSDAPPGYLTDLFLAAGWEPPS